MEEEDEDDMKEQIEATKEQIASPTQNEALRKNSSL